MSIMKEIVDNWENGNLSDARQQMKDKTKTFALDLVCYLVGERDYEYYDAVEAVQKMCEEIV